MTCCVKKINFVTKKKAIKKKSDKPKIIMCNTVKGKGIPRIENKLLSHYKPAEISDLDIFL